jgi:hypothetical protein
MIKNFQQSSHPFDVATDLFSSLKMTVISAKKSRKKGKTAPETMAPKVPMISKILSEEFVYVNKAKNEEGGAFFA